MTDIAGLLERVQAATGPDRELDVSICLALNYMPYIDDQPLNMRRSEHETTWLNYECMENGKSVDCTDDVPSLTKSVDAALSLVERKLPGRAVAMGLSSNPSPFCGIAPSILVNAATLPLAILAALLSALPSGDAS